jgi:hypothetical protein
MAGSGQPVAEDGGAAWQRPATPGPGLGPASDGPPLLVVWPGHGGGRGMAWRNERWGAPEWGTTRDRGSAWDAAGGAVEWAWWCKMGHTREAEWDERGEFF